MDRTRSARRCGRTCNTELISSRSSSLTARRTTASYSAEEIQTAVDEAHRAGKLITAHASARPDTSLRLCLAAGVDSLEHAIPQTDEQIDLYLNSGAAFVRTFTIGFQTQTDWAWFAGKDIEGRVNVMRGIVTDAFENAPATPGASDYYRTGISLRDRLHHTREVVIPMFQKAVEQGRTLDGRHGQHARPDRLRDRLTGRVGTLANGGDRGFDEAGRRGLRRRATTAAHWKPASAPT